MQAMLLRFLETGEIQSVGSPRRPRARRRAGRSPPRTAICAERVAAGEFREDLLYRLRVIHIQVPPLRERRDDIRAAGRAPAHAPAAPVLISERRWQVLRGIAGPATCASCRT